MTSGAIAPRASPIFWPATPVRTYVLNGSSGKLASTMNFMVHPRDDWSDSAQHARHGGDRRQPRQPEDRGGQHDGAPAEPPPHLVPQTGALQALLRQRDAVLDAATVSARHRNEFVHPVEDPTVRPTERMRYDAIPRSAMTPADF